MTKRLPSVKRGEIIVKLHVQVDPGAFGSPTIEQSIRVADWADGIPLTDIDLKQLTITRAEADQIRRQRQAALVELVREMGYTVAAECSHGDDCLVHEGGVGCDG